MCFMTTDRFDLATKTLHLQRCLDSVTIDPIYGTYRNESNSLSNEKSCEHLQRYLAAPEVIN